jgi:hypothetical protein
MLDRHLTTYEYIERKGGHFHYKGPLWYETKHFQQKKVKTVLVK